MTTHALEIPELVAQICNQLGQDDSHSIAQAAQVCRQWSRICTPILWKQVRLKRTTNMASFEAAVIHYGHYCRRLVAHDVSHWSARVERALLFMPRLEDLEATWMGSELLQSVIQLQQLQRLCIPRLQGSLVSQEVVFLPAFKGSPLLSQLDMASTDLCDTTLLSLAKGCPKLTHLNISDNRCLTSRGLAALARRGSSSSTLSTPSGALEQQIHQQAIQNQGHEQQAQLVALEIDDHTEAQENEDEDDELICPQLRSISMTNCRNIGPEGFLALFSRPKGGFEHVNVTSCKINDDGLFALARTSSATLKSLTVNCCASISNQGILAIVRSCKQLESLAFVYCHRVTAEIFFGQEWACKNLKELKFSLNKWHRQLIMDGLPAEIGLEDEQENEQDNDQDHVVPDDHIVPAQNQQEPAMVSQQPLFQYTVLGYVTPPTANPVPTALDQATETTLTRAQRFRQSLILSQFCRQLSLFTSLESLELRDIQLPIHLVSTEFVSSLSLTLSMLEISGNLGSFSKTDMEQLKNRLGNNGLKKLSFRNGFSVASEAKTWLSAQWPALEFLAAQVKD